jgi:hypothetical protein
LGVGAVGAGLLVVGLVSSSGKADPPKTGTTVTPVVGPGTVGVEGSF